jgi:hypothetical protein
MFILFNIKMFFEWSALALLPQSIRPQTSKLTFILRIRSKYKWFIILWATRTTIVEERILILLER